MIKVQLVNEYKKCQIKHSINITVKNKKVGTYISIILFIYKFTVVFNIVQISPHTFMYKLLSDGVYDSILGTMTL